MRGSASNPHHVGVSLLVLAVAGILATGAWIWLGPRAGLVGREDQPLEGLQVLWPVPDFSPIERSGRPVTLADLRGTVDPEQDTPGVLDDEEALGRLRRDVKAPLRENRS